MTRYIIQAFHPGREAGVFQSALNEVSQAYTIPGGLEAAYELFEGRWSAEYSVLMIALTRGQIARTMGGAHTVAWPSSIATIFAPPRRD